MLGKFLNSKEDSLTAAVFSTLWHLPTEMAWRILRNACYSSDVPLSPGEPERIEFWPSWSAADTRNSDRVVPDVFIRFSKLDLIVEAKRWDDEMQDPEQWKNQVLAYRNEYGSDQPTRELRLLAVGGLWHEADERIVLPCDSKRSDLMCVVHMCRWRRILAECQRAVFEFEQVNYTSSTEVAYRRTLKDTIDLFAWHGFATGKWFHDFRFEPNLLTVDDETRSRIFSKLGSIFKKR